MFEPNPLQANLSAAEYAWRCDLAERLESSGDPRFDRIVCRKHRFAVAYDSTGEWAEYAWSTLERISFQVCAPSAS